MSLPERATCDRMRDVAVVWLSRLDIHAKPIKSA